MIWPFERVYLIRHGQTRWNREGRRQGRLDSPLTAEGRAQADGAARLMQPRPVDALFSSPLGRTRATAERVGRANDLAVQIVDALVEVDHGRYNGLTHAEIADDDPEFHRWRAEAKYERRFPDGESYADAEHRAGLALVSIAARGVQRPVLVVHEMIGRMLLGHLLALTPGDALDQSIPHGAVVTARPGTGAATVIWPAPAPSVVVPGPYPGATSKDWRSM